MIPFPATGLATTIGQAMHGVLQVGIQIVFMEDKPIGAIPIMEHINPDIILIQMSTLVQELMEQRIRVIMDQPGLLQEYSLIPMIKHLIPALEEPHQEMLKQP